MRLTFRRAMVATALFVLSAGISVAGASTKFSYAEEVTQTGSAVVRFEEGSLKRFDALDYRLDATAVALWASPCGGGQAMEESFPTATVALIPDANGRVSGTITLDVGPPPPLLCPVLQHVEYTSVTLTNQSSGHVYRLDPISRDFPT